MNLQGDLNEDLINENQYQSNEDTVNDSNNDWEEGRNYNGDILGNERLVSNDSEDDSEALDVSTKERCGTDSSQRNDVQVKVFSPVHSELSDGPRIFLQRQRVDDVKGECSIC